MEISPYENGAAYRVRQYLTNRGLGLGCLRFQRRKRPAFLLKSGLVRLTVRQALAGGVLDGARRPFPIVASKCNAVVVAEIVFGKVAMQMLFVAVLINAFHAAFE